MYLKSTKDRSLSSVRDRIYDDPAYTDDISHLANPLRRNSCSGKGDGKNAGAASTSTGGSSSLGKRSKLTRDFLQYAKQGKARGGSSATAVPVGGGGVGVGGGGGGGGGVGGGTVSIGSYERHASSSSDEQQRADTSKSGSMGRRGRSLERNLAAAEKSEKKREKHEQRAAKQKRNLSLDNSLKSHKAARAAQEQEARGRSKGRNTPVLNAADDSWTEVNARLPPDHDELYSVRSASKDSNSTAGTTIQIGRRFLKGEIGIKSFNYYLLKEGLKSSKKFVEKQRHSLTSGLGGSSKKLHSRSEENIYEEIFFRDAPASDEENQNQNQSNHQNQPQHQASHIQPQAPVQHQHQSQQQPLMSAGTPLSQGSEDAIYADCELCMQQCTRENCEYCLAAQAELGGSQRGMGARPFDGATMRQASLPQKTVPPHKAQFGSLGRHGDKLRPDVFVSQAQATSRTGGLPVNQTIQCSDNINGNGLATSSNMPAAHILEFQSYNPNNPGVYKIETTPVAITGEYNPILQFQQTSSSTTTTTPSEHYQHISNHQQQHQPPPQPSIQYQQHKPIPMQQAPGYLLQPGVPLTSLTNHYQGPMAVGGMVPMLPPQRQRCQRGPSGQPQFLVNYNGVGGISGAPVQRMNTKSSSSSDSLHQQQMHKYNTMARLEANVMLGDPFYGGPQMHPLMYAASRPIGGSQILVDPYEPPQIYKSDSKASILSEFSLRSSDNSHRYARYRYGGRGEVSDSSLGDSLFSYASAQRRFFGSSESCRFAFDCRRCSLDGGDKCSYSDTCRYDCRNCDCSSSYFSSDFDDVYGGGSGMPRTSGIPRKTAAGTLPSSTQPSDYERQQEQLDLKQNKYAQDFFKHVNDVKRSIYQSEMQRNNSLDSHKQPPVTEPFRTGRVKHEDSPQRSSARQQKLTSSTTLPLTKERSRVANAALPIRTTSTEGASTLQQSQPTAAPRTSLPQLSIQTPNVCVTSHSSTRRTPAVEGHGYPSLDRLVVTATGAIPKSAPSAEPNTHSNGTTSSKLPISTKNNATDIAAPLATDSSIPSAAVAAKDKAHSNAKQSTHQSPKPLRMTDRPLGLPKPEPELVKTTAAQTRSRSEKSVNGAVPESGTKRERYLNVITGGNEAAMAATAGSTSSKRHHRATSSSKSSSTSSSRRKDTPGPPPPSPATYADLQELKANLECVQDDTKTRQREEVATVETVEQEQCAAQMKSAKHEKTKNAHKEASSIEATIQVTSKMESPKPTDGGLNYARATPAEQEANNVRAATAKSEVNSIVSSAAAAAILDAEDDDVFYDARSEDSAGTGANAASSNAIRQAPHERRHRKDAQYPSDGQRRPPERQDRQIVGKVSPEGGEKLQAPQQNDCKFRDTPERENETERERERCKRRKDNSESRVSRATKDGADARAGNNAKRFTDEMQSTMTLNLAEPQAISTTTTTITATPTSTPTTPATSFEKRDNSKPTKREDITSTRDYAKAKRHERRSKATSSRSTHKVSTAAAAAATSAASTLTSLSASATLTISCDTCCQMECDQQQEQQKINEARAKLKASKERASKIKAETKTKEPRNDKSPTKPPTAPNSTTMTCADMLPMPEPDASQKFRAPADGDQNVRRRVNGMRSVAASSKEQCSNVASESLRLKAADTCCVAASETSFEASPTSTTATSTTSTTAAAVVATAAQLDAATRVTAADEEAVAANVAKYGISCYSEAAGAATLSHRYAHVAHLLSRLTVQSVGGVFQTVFWQFKKSV